jgi:hypothetical protein
MFDNKKQQKINKQMLEALGEVLEAQKLQQDMINDLKTYMDKRDLLHEQMNRSIIDLLIKLK